MNGRIYHDIVDVGQELIFRDVTYDPDRQPVRVSTQADVPNLATGAPLSPDGFPVVAGDRVLVRAQAAPIQNGLYIVVTPGTAVNGSWIRSTDFAAGSTPVSKCLVAVQEGTDAGNFYYLDTTGIPIVGTNPLTWAQLGGGGGGGGDWAATLLLGNITGGTDAVLSSGDALRGVDAPSPSLTSGGDAIVRPGDGGGAGPAGRDGATHAGSARGSMAGNQRGANAVDLQRIRGAATQIAAGVRSTLLPGRQNTNEWNDSVVLGGAYNTLEGYGYNNVVAGAYNYFDGNGSALYNTAIFGSYHSGNTGATYGPYGRSNLITGFSFRSLGDYNYMRGSILGSYVNLYEYVYCGHSLAGGQSIRAMGWLQTSIIWGRQMYLGNAGSGFAIGYSAIFGSQHFIARYGGDFDYGLVAGSNHTADEAIAGIVLSGRFAHASVSGMRVHALALPGGGFPSTRPGSAQANEIPLVARTANAIETEMRTTISPSGKQNKYLLDPGSLQLFRILLSARQETAGPGAEAAAWEIVGAVHNDGGTTSLLPAGGGAGLVVTLIGRTAGVMALGWTVAVSVDDIEDELVISVTGDGGATPVRWFGWTVASNVGQGV